MFRYDFKCTKCNSKFTSELLRMKDDTDVFICPLCQSERVIRLWSPVYVHYHSDGFTTKPDFSNEI